MTAVGLVMALVYAYIATSPYRALRAAVAASRWEAAGAAMGTIRRLVALNLALGMVTIAIATLGRACHDAARVRVRRLVGEREDDADRAVDPAAGRARADGVAGQARPSRVRHRPARQGQLPASRGGLHRGPRELEPSLGADARVARGRRAHARGGDRPLSPCDLVLVEGYKRSRLPKLEVYRAEVAKPWLHPDDPSIVGIASDVPRAPRRPGGSTFRSRDTTRSQRS
jgi:hypothetical protein